MEPWTRRQENTWTVASQSGQALFWEWQKGGTESLPEKFLFFLRTVFPNGGQFAQVQCSHSIIWSCVEDDMYGVGLKKNKAGPTWIVAVLIKAEAYPGSCSTPDRELSLKSHRFLAEEFLRGTDPLDIYKSERHITRDTTDWWNYLEKLEKVINWKLPEVKIFKAAIAGAPFAPKQTKWEPKAVSKSQFVPKQTTPDYPPAPQDRPRSTGTSHRVARSRSPVERTRVTTDSEVRKHPGLSRKTTAEIMCKRCNIKFNKSHELMVHLNSREHGEALAREYPI